ncbi:hypothetical protein Nepgr_011768 [Nepenthes gracilis]|uniref:Uncharacterized protein n=1 Tax=Nepenthes gracilis TaxID=150966 RepID=A0AAD3XM88_NEPGR|nr:hypothetical protein Nepgr_011768 [Nepenthes gracilis]
METCGSTCFTLANANSMSALTVLGRRHLMGSQLSGITSLKMFDVKNCSGFNTQRIDGYSSRFRCSANSHGVSPTNRNDPFLNLHPEISLLRGSDGNANISGLRNDGSSASVIENLRDLPSANNYNVAKIKVIGVGGGGSMQLTG